MGYPEEKIVCLKMPSSILFLLLRSLRSLFLLSKGRIAKTTLV